MKNLSLLLVLFLSASNLVWAGKTPTQTPELLVKGKDSYSANCLICHGAKGDGNGIVGKTMTPKPRDFSKGQFRKGNKVEQVFATITNGLEGTAMVGYKHLSENDRWALAYYVKSFMGGAAK